MGAKKESSTESALDNKTRVSMNLRLMSTMLAMNISGAFDKIVNDRLADNLRHKGLSSTLICQASSFMNE